MRAMIDTSNDSQAIGLCRFAHSFMLTAFSSLRHRLHRVCGSFEPLIVPEELRIDASGLVQRLHNSVPIEIAPAHLFARCTDRAPVHGRICAGAFMGGDIVLCSANCHSLSYFHCVHLPPGPKNLPPGLPLFLGRIRPKISYDCTNVWNFLASGNSERFLAAFQVRRPPRQTTDCCELCRLWFLRSIYL